MSGFDFVYGNITLNDVRRFSQTNWPRTRIEIPDYSFNQFGTISEQGVSREPPHTWASVQVLLSQETNANGFSEMYWFKALYDRALIAGGNIRLHDRTLHYTEKAVTPSRALARNGVVESENGFLKYAAQFDVRFNSELTWEIANDTTAIATFSLLEAGVVPA